MACLTRDGSEVIRRTINEPAQSTRDHPNDLTQEFEIHRTSDWITSNNFQHIGLQFPNELLSVAVPICQSLTCLTGRNFFILGDSTFAGCCVDEIVGQRANIDALIHYGRACLSKTVGRLPIFYVFGKIKSAWDSGPDQMQTVLDKIGSCLGAATTTTTTTTSSSSSLQSEYASPLVITYDFRFRDSAKLLYDQLIQMPCFARIYWSEPNLETNRNSDSDSNPVAVGHSNQVVRCGRIIYTLDDHMTPTKTGNQLDNKSSSGDDARREPWTLIHISSQQEAKPESFTFYRILLSLPEVDFCRAFVLDPLSGDLNSYGNSVQMLLKRRSHLIERVKDARRFGILIGTLSVDNYTNILERLKRLLNLSGRSYVTLFIGRLNEAKLANLVDLDVLVCVACPETSLVDSRDLFVPVVTPFEVECALGSLYAHDLGQSTQERHWTGLDFWLDFRDLLPGGRAYVSEDHVVPNITEAFGDVSLITGQTRIAKPSGQLTDLGNSDQTALVHQEPWTLMDANPTTTRARTWFGLDPQIGQTPVGQVKQGRQGIPTNYSDEPNLAPADPKTSA